MSIDTNVGDGQEPPPVNLDLGEGRAHPERLRNGDVPAFGMYYRTHLPADENFDGCVSVGVTGANFADNVTLQMDEVVLGFTGSTGVRLNNVLLQPGDARQLAKLLKKAAKEVER